MKKVKRQIYAGISGKYNEEAQKFEFKVDFDSNSSDDVIQFIKPYFQQSQLDGNTYWFGYSFNDGQSNPRRDQFIEFIKNVQVEKLIDPEDDLSGFDYTNDSITQPELDSMIIRSLKRINLNQYSIDAIVYPESHSGNLVQMIVKCISRYVKGSTKLTTEELAKADPEDVEFDYIQFAEDRAANLIDLPSYVDDNYIAEMVRKARLAPHFSIRKYIKPAVLRNYISNFYAINKSETVLTSASVVLVVDDFGTTGTTLREIIRNIREVNTECEIYIFTLMGNRRSK